MDWDIRRFDEIDSTNTWLLGEARNGAGEGLVAVADHQREGRGRLGRAWEAPPGSSLLVSVLLRPSLPPEQVHLVTVCAALAAADAASDACGVLLSLKWPNDVVLVTGDGYRKLAGVLAEADIASEGVRAVVVGIGMNVSWPAVLPQPLAGTALALNHIAGHDVDRDLVLDRLLQHLARRYESLEAGGASTLIHEYRRRCATIGARVRVALAGSALEGTCLGVTDLGHLIVETTDGPREVAAGDVIHVRPADPR